jgi:multidrug efflux pump subunit AcrB
MNLAKAALEYKAVTYFATFLLLAVGVLAYFSLGQLEDPCNLPVTGRRGFGLFQSRST